MIPAGVLSPEAGDAVQKCFEPLVGSADQCGLTIPPDNVGGALLGIMLGRLKQG